MAVQLKDYYAVLGLKKDASPEEIKQAYRRLAKEHHPDLHPERNKAQAAAKFREINEAYEVLSDPNKKSKYDQLGPDWEKLAQFEQPEPGRTWTYRSGAEGGEFSGFSDFFEGLFGSAGPRGFGVEDVLHSGGNKGRDIEAEMPLTLEEAYHGGQKRIVIGLPESCSTCLGSGRKGRRLCPDCGGDGQIQRERTITTQLPKHITDGAKLRLRGQGSPTPHGGPGDLFLRIKLLPHPTFKVLGSDLETIVVVSPWTAALGGEATVPTMEGLVRIKIPRDTHANRPLRISGKGLAKDGGGRGDLYAVVRIDNPDPLDERQLRLYQQLKEL